MPQKRSHVRSKKATHNQTLKKEAEEARLNPTCFLEYILKICPKTKRENKIDFEFVSYVPLDSRDKKQQQQSTNLLSRSLVFRGHLVLPDDSDDWRSFRGSAIRGGSQRRRRRLLAGPEGEPCFLPFTGSVQSAILVALRSRPSTVVEGSMMVAS